MNDMRKNFYKEIQLLRELMIPNKHNSDVINNYLKVNLFSGVEGINTDLIEALNNKISFIMEQFNKVLAIVSNQNDNISSKLK